MKQGDEKGFLEVMHYLSLNFPEREMTSDLMRSYFQDLFDYSLDDVRTAAKAYVQIGARFPLVSDFISLLSA